MRRTHWLALVAVLVQIPVLRADRPSTSGTLRLTPDEQLLQDVHLETTGPALVAFFRQQARAEIEPERLGDLLKALEDPSPHAHGPAMASLVSIGPPAVAALREFANRLDDPEASARGQKCLRYVEGPSSASLVSAAVRLLAQRQPPDAAAALLTYVPMVPSEEILREIEAALIAVGVREGKPEPALVQALSDPVPARRAVAAAIIGRAAGPKERLIVRRLYTDPRPAVRLRAALALAQQDDGDAMPVVIDLLAELDTSSRTEIEEFLGSLAADSINYKRSNNPLLSGKLRRDMWAAWWQGLQGDALLDEFRKRTIPFADQVRIWQRIQQLSSDDPEVRDRAASELILFGRAAATLLGQAAYHEDPMIRKFATQYRQTVRGDTAPPLPLSAIRLVRLRRPAHAVEVLLAYLPCAETSQIGTRVQEALASLAFRDGQADPALLNGLRSPHVYVRVISGELLVREGSAEQAKAAHRLLQDSDRQVRLRFGLFLLDRQDKTALLPLIQMLSELPLPQAVQVETRLRYVAGAQAPQAMLSADAANRSQCRLAWLDWYREHGLRLDLAQRARELNAAGPTLLLGRYGTPNPVSRVLLVDHRKQTLWQFDSPAYPLFVSPLSAERVLLIEPNSRQVREHDRQGNIVWTYELASHKPFAAQRLGNGNTFIACRNALLEIDPSGRTVWETSRITPTIAAARCWKNGHRAYLTNDGAYTHLDEQGKQVRSFRLPATVRIISTQGLDLLPNDHVLVPINGTPVKLTEFDPLGQAIQETIVPAFPASVECLPNGNLLVVDSIVRRVREVDHVSQSVWEFRDIALQPMQAFRLQAATQPRTTEEE